MELFLSMSIFSSAADISGEKGKVQEWIRAWVAREEYGKGAAAGAPPEQGKQQPPPPPPPPQPQQQQEPARAAQQKKRQGTRPWFAPEFDGINCFETIVSH